MHSPRCQLQLSQSSWMYPSLAFNSSAGGTVPQTRVAQFVLPQARPLSPLSNPARTARRDRGKSGHPGTRGKPASYSGGQDRNSPFPERRLKMRWLLGAGGAACLPRSSRPANVGMLLPHFAAAATALANRLNGSTLGACTFPLLSSAHTSRPPIPHPPGRLRPTSACGLAAAVRRVPRLPTHHGTQIGHCAARGVELQRVQVQPSKRGNILNKYRARRFSRPVSW
jgi:hypothetical protein